MKLQVQPSTSFISGSALKVLAMALMFIDHFAAFIMAGIPFCIAPFLTVFGKEFSLYFVCRMIGRVAFPLYCFLLTEGFIHTKNRKKYGLRLLIFALISELPWNFIHAGALFYPKQNVMFTLLFGYLALCVIEYFDKDVIKQFLFLIPLFLICSFGRFDYGARGLGLIRFISAAGQACGTGYCRQRNDEYGMGGNFCVYSYQFL